jgi:predicted flap endonuclease-1-like 5' DNA nuclease
MSDLSDFQGIDLETLLASTGQSFTDAQRSLLQGVDVPVTMMLSSAELELKVSVGSDANGRMLVRPVSSLDISRGGIEPGMLSTLRINLISSVGESSGRFTPAATPTPAKPDDRKKQVPDLAGLTVDAAIARLKAGQWKYVANAAGSEEIAAAGEGLQGKVMRQKPVAAATVDPEKETVQFWVNLGSIPVQVIDGIGNKLGSNLSKLGIRSIGDLSLSNVDELSSMLKMDKTRAQDFINMAGLMARLTVLGLQDEVVELLVKGVGIQSMNQLAAAKPAELYKQCRAAADSAKIRSPKSFTFTADDVAEWVNAAQRGIEGSK